MRDDVGLEIAELSEVWPILQALAPPVIDGHNATIEYVAAEIAAGRAQLVRNADGILLLALRVDRNLELFLDVWVAIGTGAHGMVEKYLPEVESIARDLGARRIVMQSPRLGWMRKLPERWKISSVTYECEVS
jgi:hypothetical protein